MGDVDEDVADAAALGQALAQRPHAEGLGRVVAGGEEVDLRLARASEAAAFAVTPVTTVWICPLPGTWRPLGP